MAIVKGYGASESLCSRRGRSKTLIVSQYRCATPLFGSWGNARAVQLISLEVWLLAAIAPKTQMVVVMEMHQVQYFLAICEEGNFTRAAKRCGVKQPSLTRAIQRLETEFKGLLFVRTPKGTILSQLGRQVRTYFLQIDNGAARAKAIAKLAARKSAMDVRRQRENTFSKSFRVSAPWRRRNGSLKARFVTSS